jgi:hypothetical protein
MDCWQAEDTSLSLVSETSRPPLTPTQPLTRWFPGSKAGEDVMFTAHLRLLPKSRMTVAVHVTYCRGKGQLRRTSNCRLSFLGNDICLVQERPRFCGIIKTERVGGVCDVASSLCGRYKMEMARRNLRHLVHIGTSY